MKLQSYDIPDDLLYTKEHEWAREVSPSVRVGITDYAAKTLNDVVYVAPSKVNDVVVQFKSMGTVESIKAVSELYSPLSGTVTRVNTELDGQRNQDEDSYRRLVEYYSRAGVKGLTILGESAERDLLSEAERQRILTMTFESMGGRLPIVVGTGNEDLRLTVQSSLSAQDLGASAVMIPPPRGLKTEPGVPNEDAIFNYFSSVGDAIEIPMVVQDFPQTNRPKMSPTLIGRLNREISNANYLKLEDPPTPLKLTRIREIAGDRLKVFSALYGRDSFWVSRARRGGYNDLISHS